MFNTEEVFYLVGVELLRRRGRQYTKELCDAIMGRPPRDSFETMIRWHGLDDSWDALAEESEDLFLSLLDGRLAPMPGLLEFLDALESAGRPKAICTSSSRRLVEGILSRFAMQPRFAFTLVAEDIVQGKPHPEIYLKAAERFGIRPEEMVVLEDSQTGARAGIAAGAQVVAVPGEHSRNHDFTGVRLVAQSLADPRLYRLLGLEPPASTAPCRPSFPQTRG